jgi:Tol biopolymer transport system component
LEQQEKMTRRFTLTGLLGLSTLCGSAALLALSPTITGCGGGGGSATPVPTPTPAPTPVPLSPTRIIFVSDKTTFGNKEIYSISIPSGTTPAASFFTGATRNIIDVTGAIYQDEAPVLSPVDSNLLAFQSDRFTPGRTAICLLDLSTNSFTQVTAPVVGEVDTDPTWSPDGTKVAFSRLTGGNTDIYIFDRATSTTTRITNDPGIDKNPAWSPNGTRLAFASNRAGSGGFDIYTTSPTGLNTGLSGRLTTNALDDEAPKWSPDSTRIIYQGKGTSRWIVFSMPASGAVAGRVQHTDEANNDERPCYSPDGQFILYHSFNITRSILSKPTSAPQTTAGTILSTSALGSDTQPFWGK